MSNCKQNPECKQGQQNIREPGTFLFFQCSLYVFLVVPLLLNSIRWVTVMLCDKKLHCTSMREHRETMANRGPFPWLLTRPSQEPSAYQRPLFTSPEEQRGTMAGEEHRLWTQNILLRPLPGLLQDMLRHSGQA